MTTVNTNKQFLLLAVLSKLCTHAFAFLCFSRRYTPAQRKGGRSTARHRTQMGSASVLWSHQPRTCVTATHAAGSFASSWRRWQLSITRSLWDGTVTHAGTHTRKRHWYCTHVWHSLSHPGCPSEHSSLLYPTVGRAKEPLQAEPLFPLQESHLLGLWDLFKINYHPQAQAKATLASWSLSDKDIFHKEIISWYP